MPSTIKHLLACPVLALGLAAPAAVADAADGAAAPPPSPERAAKPRPSSTGYGVHLTSFNILTSTMAPGGVSRAQRAARWVQGQHATAAAFQEVAPDQLRQLQRTMVGYHFWPKRDFGPTGSAIQIGWRTRDVQLRRTGHVMGPFLGVQRPVPYVQLRNRRTHRTFWVMAIHNAPSGREAERDAETRAEIGRLKKLLRTDDPVFAIGDVNERSEFCTTVARATPLTSMNGGTRRRPCPVPRHGGPDWMLGAAAHASGFAKVRNHISDHPALTVRAHVPATPRVKD